MSVAAAGHDPLTGVGPVLAVSAQGRPGPAPDLIAATPLPPATAGSWTVAAWTDHADDADPASQAARGREAWLRSLAAAWAAGAASGSTGTQGGATGTAARGATGDQAVRAYAAGPDVPWGAAGRDERTGEVRLVAGAGVGPGLTWWQGHDADGVPRLVAASHPAPTVARVHPRPGLDVGMLRRVLLISERQDDTPYLGVRRLPPGWELRWRPGGPPLLRRWWRPEDLPVRWDLRPEEAVEAYVEALDAGIRAALPRAGDVGAMVSGGLDSTMVAASAALLLAGQGRTVRCWTHPPAAGAPPLGAPGWEQDETPLVRLLAAQVPGLSVDAVHAPPGRLAIDAGLEGARQRWLPARTLELLLWLPDVVARAREAGVTTLLGGLSGNDAFSLDGTFAPAELLRRGRLGAALDLVRHRARESGRPLARVVRGELLVPLLPTGVRDRWARSHRVVRADFRAMPLATPVGAEDVQPGWAGAMRDAERTRRYWAGSLAWTGGMHGADCAASTGVVIADPLGSRSAIEAACALPPGVWAGMPGGRALARRAAAGRVPDAIRLRTARGSQGSDWFVQIAGAQQHYREVVADFHASPALRELLDLPRLERMITQQWPSVYEPRLIRGWDQPVSRTVALGRFVRWWENGRGS